MTDCCSLHIQSFNPLLLIAVVAEDYCYIFTTVNLSYLGSLVHITVCISEMSITKNCMLLVMLLLLSVSFAVYN